MKIISLIAFLAVSGTTSAVDIRTFVEDQQTPGITRVIEPDRAIYGIPYGTSEDAFIERFGKPTGYIRITETETGMLYGNKHLFLFDGNKLSGVRITHSILDWQIAQLATLETVFDRIRWKLDSGLSEGSTLAEAKKALGDRLRSDQYGYRRHYETDKGRVDLGFAHRTDLKESDNAYTLHGILVRLR